MDDLVELIARSTGLNEGTIWQVLIERRDATVFFNQRGQPVYLEGLGTYTPSIDLEGNVNIRHRADIKPKSRVNAPGAKTLGSAFLESVYDASTALRLRSRQGSGHTSSSKAKSF